MTQTYFAPEIEYDASISPCGTYRWWLKRTWDRGREILVVVMVNPSTADHRKDDPTIKRLTAFGKRWGFGGLHVVNLFAFRASKPSEMFAAIDPVGPENDAHIAHALSICRTALAAWGNNGIGERAGQFIEAARIAGVNLICLGTTNDGHPKHPLARGKHRVPDDFEPVPFVSDRKDGQRK